MWSKPTNRREFLNAGISLAGVVSGFGSLARALGAAPHITFDPNQNIIPAPEDPGDWPQFRQALHTWREGKRRSLSYSDELYVRPDFAWVTGNFCCCFLMLCDEQFYDHRRGQYTVRHFVEHGRTHFGGYDSVVLWHAYPRIGLDERNQFDFYRDMPGGVAGLRKAIDELHRERVRVFIDYNPWDTGTRREGKSDLDAICELVRALAADGIFLDTMDKGAAEFRAKLDSARPGVILEGEGALPLERICDHHASWAQHFDDSKVPGVLRNKWFERRHLQHQIRRWNHDHTAELHAAWMNGSGMMVWENVFGSWVGWSPRDRSILRAMLPIQRQFAKLFCGESWTPLVPTNFAELYASEWESGGLRLWTLVNRSDTEREGQLMDLSLEPGEKLINLISGESIESAYGRIHPRGIGCFAAGRPEAFPKPFARFITSQKRIVAREALDPANPRTQTVLVPPRRSVKPSRLPAGMVEIGPVNVELKIQMRNRECGFYESNPPVGHNMWGSYGFSVETFTRQAPLKRYAIDLTPVTNLDFATFLRASGYKPTQAHKFLNHWRANAPVPGSEEHPVVYVDLADARAYARWARKRLPTEEEWQYAAQGPDGRKFPWGNEMLPGRCNAGEKGGTTPVKNFPDGRSPFGLYDMCGNVWEWTESERSDGRTRFSILRGGSFYSARGSGWYMDGGPRPVDFAAKFLLTWGGLDRCSSIGFRCVVDL